MLASLLGQQLSPAEKKARDMAEAIPTRAKMATCRNARNFILVDKAEKEETMLPSIGGFFGLSRSERSTARFLRCSTAV